MHRLHISTGQGLEDSALRGQALGGQILKVFCALLICATVLFCLPACQQQSGKLQNTKSSTLASSATIKSGTLTVGVNTSNSPYAGTNSSGDIVGLDADIAAALAQELGLNVQLVDVKADGKAQLSEKKIDVALGTSKSGNDEKIAYSSAYINDGAALFMDSADAAENVKAVDFKNLNGQKIVVQSSTTAAREVQEVLGLEATTAVATMKDAFDTIDNGSSKYVVADAVIGDYTAKDNSNIKNVGYLSAESVRPMYAVSLSENSELTQAINKAIETLLGNGTIRVIAAKWLGSESESLLPGKTDMSTLPNSFAAQVNQVTAPAEGAATEGAAANGGAEAAAAPAEGAAATN